VNILSVTITNDGAALARRLPYATQHGDLGDTMRSQWSQVDGFVLFASVGIAVRVAAPLLDNKHTDPAIVCVDQSGRWVVPVTGGHGGGANALAQEVAGLLGATAVLTTATDSAGVAALDTMPGFVASGDIAGVTRRLLDGENVTVRKDLDWPFAWHSNGSGTARATVVVTDRLYPAQDDAVVLSPPSLVAGIGSAAGVSSEEVDALLDAALASEGLDRRSVGCVATIDLKANEAGIVALGLPMVTFAAEQLAGVDVPNPSDVVQAEVGTPSVSEAAALLAAGPGSTLVVSKMKSAMATVAIARRAQPQGHLSVIGLGPGLPLHRTPAASMAVRNAQVLIGFNLYVDQCEDLITTHHEVIRSPIGAEADRCRLALARAAAGDQVALVCSGDSGVFAMASLVLELAPEYGNPPIDVVPGVTAALAAAAVLGAPLGHDHAAISLSDLMTPWTAIEKRLQAIAEADLVVTLYNPRSLKRTWQLERAFEILRAHRPANTPVGLVTDVGRPTQRIVRTTLAKADAQLVDMLTCVVIGASSTRDINGLMVTPRGYQP
jgi:cobalt-precorrin 5A hydrolase / precorrin-3B C17-methyltransferase